MRRAAAPGARAPCRRNPPIGAAPLPPGHAAPFASEAQMSYAPAPGPLRASDAEREAAAERLRIAAGEGRLTALELEERLSAAYAARFCAELSRPTADVTPPRALAPTRP